MDRSKLLEGLQVTLNIDNLVAKVSVVLKLVQAGSLALSLSMLVGTVTIFCLEYLFLLLTHGVKSGFVFEFVDEFLYLDPLAFLFLKLLVDCAGVVDGVALKCLYKVIGCLHNAVNISIAAVGHTWDHVGIP